MELEVERVKVDTSHTTTGTEGRTETSGRAAAGTQREETIAFGQSQDISSAAQARPDNAAAAPCRSRHAKPGTEDTQPERQCPVLERSDCPSGGAATRTPDAGSRNQRVDNLTSLAAKHPGKVITTDVTINSLTVTFLEATVAEGFFKGH